MFEPGWYHTGISIDIRIEHFANGPGFEDREFEHGPFKAFADAKGDLLERCEIEIQGLRILVEMIKEMKKEITFADLTSR